MWALRARQAISLRQFGSPPLWLISAKTDRLASPQCPHYYYRRNLRNSIFPVSQRIMGLGELFCTPAPGFWMFLDSVLELWWKSVLCLLRGLRCDAWKGINFLRIALRSCVQVPSWTRTTSSVMCQRAGNGPYRSFFSGRQDFVPSVETIF
jgi:hypothetical protein